MTTIADADMVRLGRKCWGALETLHVVGYFAPEPEQAYVDLGLHPRLSYFAARSAAFGPVGPEVTTATFYVFAPWLARKALPASWDIASPEAIQRARRAGVAEALHGILDSPDVSEALALARTACDGLDPNGRPIYAAHATLEWPDDGLMALWHAATLIREHRGDGHVAVLQSAGIDPVESLVLGGLYSSNTEFVRSTRGWSDAEWTEAEARLRRRGLLTDDGLSEDGRILRQRIEDDTDRLAVRGWARLGDEGCRRLCDLVAPMRERVLASGVLPGWISARG